MLAPASGKSLTDPALVCQQVGPSSGHVAEIGRARYFFGSGPAAPADMTLGRPDRRSGLSAACRHQDWGGLWVCPLSGPAGVPIERIDRLAGHTGMTSTETVCRKQIRPVVTGGAAVMDSLCSHRAQSGLLS
jgi:hypothetical protein